MTSIEVSSKVLDKEFPAPQPVSSKPTLAQQFNVPRRMHAFWHYAENKAKLTKAERVAEYQAEKKEFEKALSLWEDSAATELRNLLESQRSVDWIDIASDLMETYRSRGKLSVLERGLDLTYNTNFSPEAPEFKNMQMVNRFLQNSTELPSVDRFLQVHKLAMSNGVEDLPDSSLGKIRDFSVVGMECDAGVSTLELRRINSNPYLTFKANNRYKRRAAKTGRHYGEIIYPEPCTVKEQALIRIKDFKPEVYEAVLKFRTLSQREQKEESDLLSFRYRELTKEFVTALLEQVYSFYQSKRETLGDLNTREKVCQYVKFAALQEQEAMSVHPVENGNGRSLRAEILNDLFDKEGLSRPRLSDPNRDLFLPPSLWVKQVEKAILSTDQVYKDLTMRIKRGLRIESSPELLFPDPPRSIGIHIKSRGRKSVEKNVTQMPIKHTQFGAFIDSLFMSEPELEKNYNKEPLKVLEQLRERYKEFAKKSFVYSHVPKKESFGLTGIHLVDFDFRASIGVPFADNPAKWNFKIDSWYNRSLVWRGMPEENFEVSDQQILNKFSKFSWLGLSNSLIDYWEYDHEDLREWVQDEFDRYNEAVISGTLKDVVTDHISEGPDYDSSFGFSTSKNWGTAAGFAWGRGAYGYNDEEVEAVQSQIKSRILVGGYPAHKDVDVSRLKFIDPEFSYKIGQRQREVLGIGAWDPDAIMVVQTLDANRRVKKSWVRNPDQPADIWIIDGGMDFGSVKLSELSKDVVLDRIRIL